MKTRQTMTKYKNIEKYMPELKVVLEYKLEHGLVLSDHKQTIVRDYISADDLEALLAKGVEVYGDEVKDIFEHKYRNDNTTTHSGLLIGYKPIESQEPVSRNEIKEYFDKHIDISGAAKILKRILENGVSND